MKTKRLGIVKVMALLSGILTCSTCVAELTVDTYVDLSITRLQKVNDILEQENRALDPLEQELLWQQYGTTADEFLAYRSEHQEEVDGYLSAHPELQEQINSLTVRIDALIAEGETP